MEKENAKRLAPTKDTLNLLFSLCGNICAFPECNNSVFDKENNFIAQVCHIESAKEGGERFNPNSSNDDRRQYSNLMIMCYEHHKVTDNVELYPTEKMREMKAAHESKFRYTPSYATVDQIDEIYQQELQKSMQNLVASTERIETNQELHTELLNQILDRVKDTTLLHIKTDFDKQIDSILVLRSKNQHKAAILLFEKLKEQDWTNMSDRERYRIQANLGILHLDLIENEKAAEFLIDSYSLQPNEPKAIGWGILGYSLIGDENMAGDLIDKGLKIDPSNTSIYSSMVRLKKNLPLADIIELIPSDIRQHTDIAYEISRVAQAKKDHEAAITWAQIAMDGAGENKFELKAVLATTILESILSPFLVISSQVSNDIKNKARYIIDLYTQAWDEVKHSDLHESRTWFLVNRAVAKTYLGDLEGCYLDSKEALDHKKDSFTLRHVAIAAMRTRREKESLEIVAKLIPMVSGPELHELIHFEAQVHLQMGQTENGLAILDSLLQQDISENLRLFIIDFLCQRQVDLGDLDEATRLNELALDIQPSAATALLLKGKIARKRGEVSRAVKIFEQVMDDVGTTATDIDIYDLALQFEGLEIPKKAIELMEKVTDLKSYSSNTKKLLDLYYRHGETAKILKVSKELTELFGPIQTITELRSHVFEQINDFKSAIAICLTHLEVYPKDQFILVRLALVYARMEDWEQVGIIIDSIDHLDRTLKMEIQFKIAMLCHECGRLEKCHRFAQQTRRQFIDNFAAHENFIHLGTVVESEEQRPIDPSEVTLDSQVVLKSEDKEITYIIEDRKDLSRVRGEISPLSPEGVILMGRKLGDQVTLGPHNQQFEISSISHTFNAAMRESYHLIGTTFSSQTKFRQFSIGSSGNFEEDFKPIFDMLDQKSDWEKNIEKMYTSGMLPLSTIAKIRKTNLIRIWGGFVSDEMLGLKTTTDRREIYSCFSALDNKSPILLELTGLCTIAQLKCYDEISSIGSKLLVAESTILEIHELIHDLKGSSQNGSLTLGKQAGKYVRQFSSPEQISAQIEHLTNLLQWIKQNCTSLPCTAALNMNGEDKKKLDDALGEPTIDSILTAQEQKSLLYAEEAVIRMLAFEQNGVAGTATFIILLYLMVHNKIERKRFLDLSIDIMGMNYKQIPVDSHVMMAAVQRTKYRYEWPVPNVTRGLLTDMVDHEYIIRVTCDYFVAIYKQPLTFIFLDDIQELRKDIILKTLEVLSEKFQISTLELPLVSGIRKRLGDSDDDFHIMSGIISNFCRNLSSH